MIRIRRTKLQDYLRICSLLKSEGMLLANFSRNKFSRMLKRNKGFYFIATDKNKIVGNIFATYDGGDYIYIYKITVDKNYRKRGIATLLIEKLLKIFKNNKNIWAYCHIKRTNKASINLFKKQGFKIRKTHYLVYKY